MSPRLVASGPPLSLLAPFAVAFTAPTFRHVLVLVSGTILASGRRPAAAGGGPVYRSAWGAWGLGSGVEC